MGSPPIAPLSASRARDDRLSVRRTDPRFTLPAAPRRAAVLGELTEWRAGLTSAGVAEADARGADLVVAPARQARRAIALDPGAIILEGRNDRVLARAGFAVRHFVPRPRVEEPALLLPLEQPLPTSYAIRHWSVVDRRWKAWRRGVAGSLAAHARSLPLQPVVTVATRGSGLPYLLAAARELGVPASVGWVLALGQGDVLSRNVFHVFPEHEPVPEWVLKFARLPGHREPFDRDEHGLAVASAVGGVVASHAPRLLGRFEVSGVHASLETAAVGTRLRELLILPGRSRVRELVDRVAAWILEAGRASSAPAEALAAERRRLLEEVVPQWTSHGATPELVRGLPPLAAVMQHNDLGSWNVVVNGRRFTALDWESARRFGLPLWDLVYFLADVLALLDGAVAGATRHEHTRRLFRGELGTSAILFDWIRRGVAAHAIPPDAVGAIVTLCWLHHSLSHVGRSAVMQERLGRPVSLRTHGTERNAEVWLSDPLLGPTWNVWRRRA